MSQEEHFVFEGADGAELAGYSWMPAEGEAVRAVVQLHHGMAEHAARYARVARALCEVGIGVVGSDHRGHGRNIKSPEDQGFFAAEGGWSLVVRDMRRLNAWIREAHPEVPVIMLAHSMGSMLAQQYMMDFGDTVDGVALSGSLGASVMLAKAAKLLAKGERLRLGQRGRSRVLQFASFGSYNNAFKPTRTEFDWLSRDEAEVDKYVTDPLCGFMCTTQLWIDVLGGMTQIGDRRHMARIPKALPVYVFAGDKDPVSEQAASLRKLLKTWGEVGLTRVSHKFYPDARHEVLNETNRDAITEDLVAWLEGVLKACAD